MFFFCNSPLHVLQGYHSRLFSGPQTPWQAYLLASPVSITASAMTFSKPNLDRSLSQLRTFHVHCCFQAGSTHFGKSVDSFTTWSQQILRPSSPTTELLRLWPCYFSVSPPSVSKKSHRSSNIPFKGHPYKVFLSSFLPPPW